VHVEVLQELPEGKDSREVSCRTCTIIAEGSAETAHHSQCSSPVGIYRIRQSIKTRTLWVRMWASRTSVDER
jgi:hypothetical protein